MIDLDKIKDEVEPYLEKLNATLGESLTSSNTLLNRITEFYLEKKGKQIRPVLTFLLTDLFSWPNAKTIDGAAALELLHNASLIHDDVVDNSDMRRNSPTINKIWDNQIAVLVGDFFTTTALSKALATEDLRIISSIAQLGRRLTVGELDQIYNAQTNILNEDAYVKMIERKTASLFVTCAEIACYSTGAPEEDLKRLKEFARILGICFQIKDDTFDYFRETSTKLGKPTGADLLEGKISLPLLHVLLQDKEKGKTEMIDLCVKGELNEDEVTRLIDYARENGGIEYAENYMYNLYEKAKEILAFYPDSSTTRHLDLLFRYVIERNH